MTSTRDCLASLLEYLRTEQTALAEAALLYTEVIVIELGLCDDLPAHLRPSPGVRAWWGRDGAGRVDTLFQNLNEMLYADPSPFAQVASLYAYTAAIDCGAA